MQDSEDLGDAAALFGLSKKDMQKSEETFKIDDLSSKLMGFVLSQVSEMISATDIYECSGELDPGLSLVLGFGLGWRVFVLARGLGIRISVLCFNSDVLLMGEPLRQSCKCRLCLF